jgi:hypothetical protein
VSELTSTLLTDLLEVDTLLCGEVNVLPRIFFFAALVFSVGIWNQVQLCSHCQPVHYSDMSVLENFLHRSVSLKAQLELGGGLEMHWPHRGGRERMLR